MNNKETMATSDRIAVILIILLMCMQVSLHKVLAAFIPLFNYSYNPPLLCVLYVVIIGLVYLLVFLPRLLGSNTDIEADNAGKLREYKPDKGLKGFIVRLSAYYTRYSYMCFMLLLMTLAIISVDIITLVNGQLRVSNVLTHNLDYLYVYLSLPMLLLLDEGKWKHSSMINSILLLSSLSMILRIFVSQYYGLTGVELTAISRESAFEGWIRNDTLRVVPPCFIMILCPLAIYMFHQTKSLSLKNMYVLVGILTIYYVYFIWQSRIACVFIAIGIVIMLLFKVMSAKEAIIRWSVAAVGALAVLAAGGLSKITALFSTNANAVYAGENRGHYYAYDVFFAQFLQKPYGAGLNENLAELIGGDKYIWLCDAGIMYSLLPMGILIAIFMFCMFGRGIFAYFAGYKSNKMAVLILAMTVSLMVCEVSMDCFFTPTAFMVPFLLTLIEYGRYDRQL